MKDVRIAAGRPFRVWIARYDPPQSDHEGAMPGVAVATEPAEEGVMSETQAAAYVEAFNRAALDARRNIRAVAVPVVVRYQGDPQPGDAIRIPGAGRLPSG